MIEWTLINHLGAYESGLTVYTKMLQLLAHVPKSIHYYCLVFFSYVLHDSALLTGKL